MNMNGIERKRRKMHLVHMPIEAAVKTEITQVRWNPIAIGSVVAEYNYGHSGGAFVRRELRNCIRDVECELIVSANMSPH